MKKLRAISAILGTIFFCALLLTGSAYSQIDSVLEEALEEERGLEWVKEGANKVDEARRRMVAKGQEKKAVRYIDKGKKLEAKKLLERSIVHYRWLGDSLGVARVYTSLAELANQLKQVDLSREYIDAASVASGISLGNFEAEIEKALEPLANMEESVFVIPSSRPVVFESEESLPTIGGQADLTIRRKAREYAESAQYKADRAKLLARLRAAERDRKEDSTVQAFLIDKKTQEIANLEQKQLIQDLELKRQRSTRIALIVGLSLISMLLLLLWRLFTNRKKSHKQIESAYKELETAHGQLKSTQAQLVQAEKMASLGQLTAGIAHEINNPVNYISGSIVPLRRDIDSLIELINKYAHVASEKGLEGHFEEVEELKEDIDLEYTQEEIGMLLNGMMEGTERTTEIVSGLLQFSRIEEMDKKSVDLHAGLDSTLNLLSSHIKGKVEVVRDYDPTMPIIQGFPGKLNQVFMNLFSNAIQAIEKAEALYPDRAASLSLHTEYHADSKVAKIMIRDTGIGIDESILPRIFEPFFTTKDVGDGTGLGLSISYGIIADHGGKIYAENQPGGGAEFIVEIPA